MVREIRSDRLLIGKDARRGWRVEEKQHKTQAQTWNTKTVTVTRVVANRNGASPAKSS